MMAHGVVFLDDTAKQDNIGTLVIFWIGQDLARIVNFDQLKQNGKIKYFLPSMEFQHLNDD